MAFDYETLRREPAHVDALASIIKDFAGGKGEDASSVDDLKDRDVRVKLADGSFVHACYHEHAEMFTVFSLPGEAYLGCTDAPWVGMEQAA